MHRHKLTIKRKFRFAGFTFLVADKVYDPAEDSFLLAEYLLTLSGKFVRALDVGCGCGLLTVLLAKIASEVYAVDLNPMAVVNTVLNATLNDVYAVVHPLTCDLTSAFSVHTQFNLIVFNPPYLPVKDEGELELSWSGGLEGREVIDRFLEEVASYLAPGGMLLMVNSSLCKPAKTLRALRLSGFKVEVVKKVKIPWEELYLVKAVKSL